MRIKTSITLSEEIVQKIDELEPNRSAFLERAAREYLGRLEKARRDARDAEIINRNSERLNREAADVLEYQELP